MDTQDASKLAQSLASIPMKVRAPAQTKFVRVAVQGLDDGRLGAAMIGKTAIEAAPNVATPEPRLSTREPQRN
jgi:hypothetical protein